LSLLEVLIALAIAALSLGALAQGSMTGLQSARVAAHYEEAVSRARSHLAGLDPAVSPGEHSGEDGGGFAWRVLVVPETTPAGPGNGAGRPMLYTVRATVSWRMDGGERSVSLATERLGEAAPQSP